MKNPFKRESPQDRAAQRAMDDWERAQKQASVAADEELARLIGDTSAPVLVAIHAAYELANRGQIELLTRLADGEPRHAIAAVEGLCYAGCNGNAAAIEGAAAAIHHRDPAVRLQLMKGLTMVADGTPGSAGSVSTAAIRERARTALESATHDGNPDVADWARAGVRDSEGVEDVRSGPDLLTYRGRQCGEHILDSVRSL